MLTYLAMGAFLCLYAGSVLWNVKYDAQKASFFDVRDTNALKGLFCIVIMLVHVPDAYSNKIQDIIASFGYIGVTFFFMASAFGLKYGVSKKKDYLRNFWWKRLPVLLVPMLLRNVLAVGMQLLEGRTVSFADWIRISGWVKILLLFYVIFWLVYSLPIKSEGWKKYGADLLICASVLALSLVHQFTPFKVTIQWPTEVYGFIYGVLLYDGYDALKAWTGKNWPAKGAALLIVGGVCGVAYLKWKHVAFIGDYCLKILLGFALLLLILHLLRRFTLDNPILRHLAKISYEVYLLHLSVYGFAARCLGIQNSGVFICVSVLITLVLATFVQWVSEKILSAVKK